MQGMQSWRKTHRLHFVAPAEVGPMTLDYMTRQQSFVTVEHAEHENPSWPSWVPERKDRCVEAGPRTSVELLRVLPGLIAMMMLCMAAGWRLSHCHASRAKYWAKGQGNIPLLTSWAHQCCKRDQAPHHLIMSCSACCRTDAEENKAHRCPFLRE